MCRLSGFPDMGRYEFVSKVLKLVKKPPYPHSQKPDPTGPEPLENPVIARILIPTTTIHAEHYRKPQPYLDSVTTHMSV